jgi:hypothetical protein
VAHFVAKKVARADVDEAVLFNQFGGLSAFARPRRAKEYQNNHRYVVRAARSLLRGSKVGCEMAKLEIAVFSSASNLTFRQKPIIETGSGFFKRNKF